MAKKILDLQCDILVLCGIFFALRFIYTKRNIHTDKRIYDQYTCHTHTYYYACWILQTNG